MLRRLQDKNRGVRTSEPHSATPLASSKRKHEVIDLTLDTPPSTPPKKRVKAVDHNQKTPKTPKKSEQPCLKEPEKRLRHHRTHPPHSFKAVYDRAMTQRMYVVSRKRYDNQDGPLADAGPVEEVELAGTTGNIYTIKIKKVPECNCPHALKGNQCKHIIYVLVRTLKAPAQLQYQLAFLSMELNEIFANAPRLPSEVGDDSAHNGKRKPVEDDCPICCVEFDDKETVVWCKAACGNNIHEGCFDQWATQKRANGDRITCPFCRTVWEEDVDEMLSAAKAGGYVNEDGYRNVAGELGLSGKRDYSMYHQPWVRQQRLQR